MDWDTVIVGADVATMVAGGNAYGAISDGAVALAGGRIAWVGPRSDLPAEHGGDIVDLGGGWLTPGLIDCHTHLVYGGDRAAEFELRLKGASYEEIARAGGGILSTVTATRAASEDDLLAGALARVDGFLAEGVTALEIKSGYGLDVETEARQLRVARRIAEQRPVTVRTTFLGAHALPPEFAGRADDYIDFVCSEAMPAIAAAGLADAVDVFCESIGFTPAQTEKVFQAATALGLPIKAHVEQLSDQGGAALAARYGALSCDHVEYLGQAGVAAMATAGSVAVLLPGAFYTLRETRLPPIDLLRDAGVAMAVASDANPGSSPAGSLLLMLNMACTLFRLTPEEALAGATREAARALGLTDSHGTIEPGKVADLAIWDIALPAELSYRLGANPCRGTVRGGTVSFRNPKDEL